MKKISRVLLSVLLVFLFALLFLFFYIKALAQPVEKGEASDDVRIEIPSGCSVYNAGKLLKENNLIKSEKLFYYTARYPLLVKILYPKIQNYSFTLKSGIYHIQNNMNIAQIQMLLSSGKQEYIKVSIPEGYTISQIGALLEENSVCSAALFKNACRSAEVCEKYGIPADSCEGYLFPDTYFLTAGMNVFDIVYIMIDNFFEKIKNVPGLAEQNSQELFYTVRLASIVEREYRLEEEAPLIASVFKNRIKENIGLYSCATIVYIITEIEGRPHPDRILISDTKIDSPYNTYKWAGLPPGAISNPGLVALDAVTNTPKTNYYFFQIVDEKAGKHVFTKSFEEHVNSHNLYIKK